MLAEQQVPRGMEKKVCIKTEDQALRSLLTSLLESWYFKVENELSDGVLLLAEEGFFEAEACQQVLWLSHSTYSSRNRVQLPLEIETLYTSLERKFHSPPRRHLRMTLNLPVKVRCRGEDYSTSLTSLSDRGCRVAIPRELVKDESLQIEFSLAGHPMDLAGHVIYSFQRPGSPENAGFDTGVLFAEMCDSECLQLREFILACYLSRVRSGIEPHAFSRGLSYLKLSDSLREQCQTEAVLN